MSTFVKYIDVPTLPVKGPISRRILAYGPSLMSVEVSFLEPYTDVPHSHPHDQICMVLEGMFEFNLDGEMILMNPGDSIFVTGNLPHCINALTPGKALDIFSPLREDFLK
jgi:quercetin dioxygenase-like cupin family protein